MNEARIGPNGGLELDRVWALYSSDGRWVNAKRTVAMHLIRAAYSPDISSVTLTVPGDRRNIPAMTFAFPGDADGAAEWFSMYFEQAIQIRYTREGFPDDGLAPGPTIVSTASLETVCDWFPGLTLDEARRRFRTTLEIDAAVEMQARPQNGHTVASEKLPAFWEDQLFAESETSVVRFRIGDVAFEGSNPCARCPFPLANHKQASRRTSSKNVSPSCVARNYHRGRLPNASITSIASPPTPASPALNKANSYASAIHLYFEAIGRSSAIMNVASIADIFCELTWPMRFVRRFFETARTCSHRATEFFDRDPSPAANSTCVG